MNKTIVNIILKLASFFMEKDPQYNGVIYWRGNLMVAYLLNGEYDNQGRICRIHRFIISTGYKEKCWTW